MAQKPRALGSESPRHSWWYLSSRTVIDPCCPELLIWLPLISNTLYYVHSWRGDEGAIAEPLNTGTCWRICVSGEGAADFSGASMCCGGRFECRSSWWFGDLNRHDFSSCGWCRVSRCDTGDCQCTDECDTGKCAPKIQGCELHTRIVYRCCAGVCLLCENAHM